MHNRAVPFFKPSMPQPHSLYRDSDNGYCARQNQTVVERSFPLRDFFLKRRKQMGRDAVIDSSRHAGICAHGAGEEIPLQVGIVLVGEGLVGSSLHLLAVLLDLLVVDLDLRRSESGGGDELLFEVLVCLRIDHEKRR